MKLINHTFKVKKYHIDTQKNINKKIALISDIHFSKSFKKEKINLIIKKLESVKPDYICIPGDLIDHSNAITNPDLKNMIISFLKELSKITKVIISIGNHDHYILEKKAFRCEVSFDNHETWFKEISSIKNVKLLDNDTFNDENITFIGFTPSDTYYEEERKNEKLLLNELKENMPKLNSKKFNVLLCHSPLFVLTEKTIEKTEVKNVNLILSGHMHNGVVPPILDSIFKGNKGIFSPDNTWLFNTRLTRGKFELSNKTLIISGGITKIHDCSPNILIPLNELFPMSLDIIEID